MTINRQHVCPNCPEVSEFVHTINGVVCTSCLEPAITVSSDVSEVVPFGLTRQLEALDRMMAL